LHGCTYPHRGSKDSRQAAFTEFKSHRGDDLAVAGMNRNGGRKPMAGMTSSIGGRTRKPLVL